MRRVGVCCCSPGGKNVFAHWPEKRWLTSSLIALFMGLGSSQTVLARDVPLSQEAAAASEPLVATDDVRVIANFDGASLPDSQQAPAKITFSRAADGQGRNMYGHRDAFSQTSSLVIFSTVRPRTEVSTAASRSALTAARSGGPVGPLPRFLPVTARLITSGFGSRLHPILGVQRNHLGVDLAVPSGTPIAATANGVVFYAGWDGGYGLLVAVDHGAGIETRYAHMSRIAVSPGQRVRSGDVLGYVGTSGLTTGPHVHYEVRVNGQAVSPFTR